ncbi:MAG: hypothetical protein ACRDNS_19465 [Trebonia sp.]
MTAQKRRLQIDDPLGGGQPVTPPKPADPQSVANRRPRTAQPAKSSDGQAKRTPQSNGRRSATAELWRDWSGLTGVGSFRLPHELLAELGDTARELGLPVGLMATAAIAQLLDQPPEQIATLVDRADDARIHGRRSSRRPLTKPTAE